MLSHRPKTPLPLLLLPHPPHPLLFPPSYNLRSTRSSPKRPIPRHQRQQPPIHQQQQRPDRHKNRRDRRPRPPPLETRPARSPPPPSEPASHPHDRRRQPRPPQPDPVRRYQPVQKIRLPLPLRRFGARRQLFHAEPMAAALGPVGFEPASLSGDGRGPAGL